MAAAVMAMSAVLGAGQMGAASGPPPSGAIFPLSEVHKGLHATAWTVFQGNKPEPMDVEVLGILRGGRGPGQDMILVQLHGTKPEYTGVVAGMSGSPVYVDGRLMGALAYRIGQFARDPIAGITPIEQMMAVRDLPLTGSGSQKPTGTDSLNMKPMETPLTMSGFSVEAIRFWQERMAGTGLETVAAGGASSAASPAGEAPEMVPGSAVSALLVRGDMEIAATCTVTYIDPRQLLACGHPLFQLGTVELPMTATEVVATLASPLNAFKIVNTGAVIGAFTEDRDAAIRGELGRRARMIPIEIALRTPESGRRVVKVEILDQPGLTEQAAMVVLIQALVPALSNTSVASYHVKGAIRVAGMEAIPLDLWAVPTDAMPAPIAAAIQLGERLGRVHANSTRQTAVEGIDLEVDALPRKALTELRGARLLGSNTVHAGDLVEVEATLQPFQSEARKVRLSFRLPARMTAGTVRLLLSDATTLDRALGRTQEQAPGPAQGRMSELNAVAAESRTRHAADRLYLSLLEPGTQATMGGQTLSDLPLSVANSLEPLRTAQAASLNGETAELVAEVEAGELITGFEVLTLHMEAGAGLN
jgi:hypothetical protein